MKQIHQGYERIQKAKRRLKHEHSLRYSWMYFSWWIKSLQRTSQGRVLPHFATLQHLQKTCSMNGRTGRWRTWTFSLLGKPSMRLLVIEVGRWQIRSKKISWRSLRSFCIPNRTCSRLGWGFLADPGWGTLPIPKETGQITSSSQHKSHNTNHIHPTHQAIAIHCWVPSIPSITSNPSCIDGMIQRTIVAV